MAKFKLEMDCDNAAFEDGNRNHEVARILREIADKLEDGIGGVYCRDANGNKVGYAQFADE